MSQLFNGSNSQSREECSSPGRPPLSCNQLACPRPLTSSQFPCLKNLNVGALGSFNSSAMDDPRTPLHVPAGTSFDTEFHQPDFFCPPHNMDEFQSNCADSFELLENETFDMDQFEQFMSTNSHLLTSDCLNQFEEFITHDSILPPDCLTQQLAAPEDATETIPVNNHLEMFTQQQDEETIMDFDELISLDMGEQATQPPPPLQLDIKLAKSEPNEQAQVTTPVLIQLLLENEALAENVPALPAVVQEVKDEPVASPRASTSKAGANRGSKVGASDLRRVRNNIASKKSRENRRNRLVMQKKQVEELEAGNKRLETKIRQLEALRDELMKHITPQKG